MQRLEVSGVLRLIYRLLGVKSFITSNDKVFKSISWLRHVYNMQFCIYFLFQFAITQRAGKFRYVTFQPPAVVLTVRHYNHQLLTVLEDMQGIRNKLCFSPCIYIYYLPPLATSS